MGESTSVAMQRQIDRMNAGDPSARNALIEKACDRLRVLTRHMLKDFSRLRPFVETDDVLQSALLRLWRSLEKVPIATAAEFLRFAASQIRRELIDLVRHYYGPEGSAAHRAETPTDSAAATQEPGVITFDPSRLLAWQEFHERVGALPAEDRTLVDLLWYHEWTHQDVAVMLQCSVSTIRRRWIDLRMRLAEFLPSAD